MGNDNNNKLFDIGNQNGIVKFDIAGARLILQSYRENMQALKDEFAEIPDCSTKDGYNLTKERISKMVGFRGAVDKKRKELKAEALQYNREVEAGAQNIIQSMKVIEEPYKEAKAAIDDEKKRAEEAKALEEQKRRDEILESIGLFKDIVVDSVDDSSEVIAGKIQKLADSELIEENFQEFFAQAFAAKEAAISGLKRLHAVAETREQKEAEEKKENERIAKEQAEQAEKLRIEREKFEKEQAEQAKQRIAKDQELACARAAEEKRIALERKQFEAEKAKQEEERARLQAIENERIAKELAKQKAIDDERARIQKEEDDKRAAEKAEIAKQQAEIDRQRREQEERDRVAQEKKDAEEKAARDAKEKEEADRANEERQKKNRVEIIDSLEEKFSDEICDESLYEIADYLMAGNVPHMTYTG